MNQETYKIETLQDLVQFDENTLSRVLDDLVVWHKLRRRVVEMEEQIGFSMGMQPYMLWMDDGKTGLQKVNITMTVRKE